MTTKTTTISVTLTLAGALLLGGCSTAAQTPAPTPTVSATSAATTDAPTTTPTTEPVVEAPAAVATTGDIVAAGDIEALRTSGASVYVSPNGDGSGLVIDPTAPLPEVIVQDIVAAGGGDEAPRDITEFGQRNLKVGPMANEIKASGASAFYLVYSGSYGADGTLQDWGYVVSSINIEGSQAFFGALPMVYHKSKAAAIAEVQPLMDANPGVQLIDTVG